jgi:chemotaxis response regulator CheB
VADDIEPEPGANSQQPDAEPNRLAQPVDAEQPPRLPFPVVGVGASAGGIEAFGEFLDAMRPDGGMAFVFVLHLPPKAESHLAEILAHRTAMAASIWGRNSAGRGPLTGPSMTCSAASPRSSGSGRSAWS